MLKRETEPVSLPHRIDGGKNKENVDTLGCGLVRMDSRIGLDPG